MNDTLIYQAVFSLVILNFLGKGNAMAASQNGWDKSRFRAFSLFSREVNHKSRVNIYYIYLVRYNMARGSKICD